MLDFFRQEKNMTMEELGAYLGRNKSTVSRWISGERYPKIEEVEQIVSFFDTDIETLLFGANKIDTKNSILSLINETSSQLSPPRQQKVYDFAENQLKEQEQEIKRENNPITSLEQFRKKKEEETVYGTTKWYGAVSAGTGEFLTDETCEEIELPVEQIPDEADFCLSINGDSMEPIFHDNDYVFVKRQSEIFSGNIGVVIVNGESFLKRIWFENNNIRLESFNKKYKDIIITENDEFRIVGKVVM
ncbi:helix-turn-helix transcriptional regulator [Enterococcus faecalis]|nr:XRE family transcriptional regulator [Enterococcus faecalis]EKJ5046408.1 helix-turn-helix transcriptional regulator [Enterococcus faecalis]EKL7554288.1 helix-turn-helix transcriptional regulator [Enterococcus faecalis]EKZ0100152.1 helix-turn-helix transcriptional regulator [Enterococcus faecalis]